MDIGFNEKEDHGVTVGGKYSIVALFVSVFNFCTLDSLLYPEESDDERSLDGENTCGFDFNL